MQAWLLREILLYLYSRGKVWWYCSEALFNLLQSNRGGWGPETRATTPNRVVYLQWQEACMLSSLPASMCHSQQHSNLASTADIAAQTGYLFPPLLLVCSTFQLAHSSHFHSTRQTGSHISNVQGRSESVTSNIISESFKNSNPLCMFIINENLIHFKWRRLITKCHCLNVLS